ncbi:hypothetical protein DL771_000716 [Monosporascus sp. 5C6A]|nr:hypothetical protein DL771_000716 [Monosporascus sp. 5C6A]
MPETSGHQLCKLCDKLYFNKLFFSRKYLGDWSFTRSLKHVREATHCAFYRLTLAIVSSCENTKGFEDASTIGVEVENFGFISKLAPAVSSTVLEVRALTLSEVKPINRFRMAAVSREVVESLETSGYRFPSLDAGNSSDQDDWLDDDGNESISEDASDLNSASLLVNRLLLWLGEEDEGDGDEGDEQGSLKRGIQAAAPGKPDEQPSSALLLGRLIDVNRRCVVEAPLYCSYAALSYVWGLVKQLLLVDETFEHISTPGALSDNYEGLPFSVKDAMLLCERLAIPFLWVDALCIRQDSREDKDQQIGQMGLIYSGATLTIVSAAGEDSNGGLPGLRPNSRTCSPNEESIRGLRLVPAQPSFFHSMSETKWETRGWTFQEKTLSQRLLIFTDSQAFYHCNRATWFEDAFLENPDPNLELAMTRDGQLQHFSKPPLDLSAFDTYVHMVKAYTSRDLTNPLDMSGAFKGVESTLSGSFGDNPFLYGLPQAEFESAIRWHAPGHFPDQRLKENPSWSWQGWTWGARRAVWFDQPVPVGDWETGAALWHRPNENGGFAILPTDAVVCMERLGGPLQRFWSGVEKRPFQYIPEKMPPLSHLISSTCTVIPLSVDYDGIDGEYGCKRYKITSTCGSPFQIGEVDLNVSWREAQGAVLDLSK